MLQISIPSPLPHTYTCTYTHRWAMAEGYGAHLIKHPELIADMVSQAGSRSGLPVSIKIRIHNDLRSVGVVKKTHRVQENLVTQALSCRKTVELVQRAERAGVAWITVHGRTTPQRMEPANMEAIKLVGGTIRAVLSSPSAGWHHKSCPILSLGRVGP